MRTITVEKLIEMQKNIKNVRNISILAHVDHGKTTLADCLVASNGIISNKMAGKLRYMDNLEDEQARGITMKSSAISLAYTSGGEDYLVNLIDSPGHIDFSSEVSTAVRLCDGAIVVVDVVEGICPQTHAVLRQAWTEGIRPVLVLNKLDRLIAEVKMSPLEAHIHLMQLLEKINAVTAELFTSEHMATAFNTKNETVISQSGDSEGQQVYDWSAGLEHVDDSSLYFSPDMGNVVFASALNGWAFGIKEFAQVYGNKLGIREDVLNKTLWGDYYLDMKEKKIRKGAQAKGKKPLFVQFVLENIWTVYETCLRRDREKLDKIVASLNLKVNDRDLKHTDPKVTLQAVCSQWLPLATAVMDIVISQLPSPRDMSDERCQRLLCSRLRAFTSLPQQTQKLKQDFLACSVDSDAPVVVFISKMVPVDRQMLPQNRPKPLTAEELANRRELARQRLANKLTNQKEASNGADVTNSHPGDSDIKQVTEAMGGGGEVTSDADDKQKFVAFARVFSGTLRQGQQLYVLGPKHDPSLLGTLLMQDGVSEQRAAEAGEDDQCMRHVSVVTVGDLYLLMGREMETLTAVPAGNVCGIGGLEDHVIKSATLSTTLACPAFTELQLDAAPILRVALEPKHASDVSKLVEGLRLLNQADPCVEVYIQEKGEHVLVTAGEIHLQKCLDDLRTRYAKIDISVSPPIVPFRETIVAAADAAVMDSTQENETCGDGSVEMQAVGGECTLKVKAVPLPPEVTVLLHNNVDLLKAIDKVNSGSGTGVSEETLQQIRQLKIDLCKAFDSCNSDFADVVDNIWSFGPRRVGPNILVNRVPAYVRPSVWSAVEGHGQSEERQRLREYDGSVVLGFQLTTLNGPICDEPLMGVCFFVEAWTVNQLSAATIEEEVVGLTLNDDVSAESGAFSQEDGSSSVQMSDDAASSHDGSSAIATGAGSRQGKRTARDRAVGSLTGRMVTCMKECCRRAFQTQPQRLMAAMYSCNIQATADVLGKMYGVLGKRSGRVLQEELIEGSSVFNIQASLPVAESFGFAEEMRKKTSGLAYPQLRFTHWEVINVDPFWVPSVEEYELGGDKADSENRARVYMNTVRRRKGLSTDDKLVEKAEKQRTLSKNK